MGIVPELHPQLGPQLGLEELLGPRLLTLPQWCKIWQRSGHFYADGLGVGSTSSPWPAARLNPAACGTRQACSAVPPRPAGTPGPPTSTSATVVIPLLSSFCPVLQPTPGKSFTGRACGGGATGTGEGHGETQSCPSLSLSSAASPHSSVSSAGIRVIELFFGCCHALISTHLKVLCRRRLRDRQLPVGLCVVGGDAGQQRVGPNAGAGCTVG